VVHIPFLESVSSIPMIIQTFFLKESLTKEISLFHWFFF